MRTALALQGRIALRSTFDRKHYFYHDLPHGYQITQKETPVMSDGVLRVQEEGGKSLPVRIKHLQIEMVPCMCRVVELDGQRDNEWSVACALVCVSYLLL